MTSRKTSPDLPPDLDQYARACYRDAEANLSARTVAELHRRRICADRARVAGRWSDWPLAAALGGMGALALSLGLLVPGFLPADTPVPITAAVWDGADALDALDAINLTALDEDSEFFLWLSANEASLLAME